MTRHSYPVAALAGDYARAAAGLALAIPPLVLLRLNPVVTATHQREGYRIENVMYQSRPDFWITANLYVPTRGAGPYPGVLSPCGHYDPGRFYPDYQLAYRTMVENGFVDSLDKAVTKAKADGKPILAFITPSFFT